MAGIGNPAHGTVTVPANTLFHVKGTSKNLGPSQIGKIGPS